MTRNRESAKAAGAKFERKVAEYLARELDDDRIERRVTNGAKDRGDIGGVRFMGQRVVIECKNVKTKAMPQWLREAEIERGNDDALVGVVCHKRHGVGDIGQQYVTMTPDTYVLMGGFAEAGAKHITTTLAEFVELLGGGR